LIIAQAFGHERWGVVVIGAEVAEGGVELGC
jgi:hypothetical protein